MAVQQTMCNSDYTSSCSCYCSSDRCNSYSTIDSCSFNTTIDYPTSPNPIYNSSILSNSPPFTVPMANVTTCYMCDSYSNPGCVDMSDVSQLPTCAGKMCYISYSNTFGNSSSNAIHKIYCLFHDKKELVFCMEESFRNIFTNTDEDCSVFTVLLALKKF